MDAEIVEGIRKYIKEKHIGDGVIQVSDVSNYCGFSDGMILKELVKLEKLGEVKMERRYSCPDFHQIRECEFTFCSACNKEYPEELINVYFSFKLFALLQTKKNTTNVYYSAE